MKQNKQISVITMGVFIIMNFVLTMSSALFNGILDKIAVDLAIPLSQTGYLTSFYAYGAGIGVPIFLVVFRKYNRTTLLKLMLFLNIVVTTLSLFSPNYSILLLTRFLMGLTGNCYSVLATATIAAISPKEKVGKNLALLITGGASALMVGIPLTRILSAIYSWQSIFVVLVLLMIFSLGYMIFYLPEFNQDMKSLNLKAEFELFKQKNVIVALSVSLISFIGYGAFYTYLTPYILNQFPEFELYMSLFLMIIGFCSFFGNLMGGVICDHLGFYKSLLMGTVCQVLISIIILVTRNTMILNIIFILFWMINGWFIGLQINTGITIVTQNKSNLMISLNSSGIQLGQAIGTSVASLVIASLNISFIVLLSTITAIIAGILLVFNHIHND
ncbi:MFS transporter [Thomasclavelia sp.]